jgi:hypothetical protein
MAPGHNDNALGWTIRIGVPIALLVAAYLVAFCPCDTLLACEGHGAGYFALIGLAISGVATHMHYGHNK